MHPGNRTAAACVQIAMYIADFIAARIAEDEELALRRAYAARQTLAFAELRADNDADDPLLRSLAAPWSNHPDFQPAWAL